MLALARTALAVALVDDLGLDDLVVVLRAGAVGRLGLRASLGGLGLLVDGGTHLLADLGGPLGGGLDGLGVVALLGLLYLGQRLAHLGLDVLGHLVLVLAEELLGRVDEGVGLVANLGLLAAAAVLLGVLLGVADHLLDVVLVQRRTAGDLDRLLLAGAQVLGGHVHDAVGVDVEGDLDLRQPAGRGGDAGQLEHAELLVVGRDLTLALEDLDLHRGLVVLGRGEDLRALGRDRGVPLDELGEDAALGLDAQRQDRKSVV